MRKYILLFYIICGLQTSFAQTNLKALKNELKYYKHNLSDYALVKASQEQDKRIIQEQAIIIEDLRARLRQMQAQLSTATVNNGAANTHTPVVEEKNTTQTPQRDMTKMPAGQVYQIQIGLYAKLNLTNTLQEPKYIGWDEVNGLYRYHIGWFDNYSQAVTFLEEVKRMGIQDAFITTYEDGQRMNDPMRTSSYTNYSSNTYNYNSSPSYTNPSYAPNVSSGNKPSYNTNQDNVQDNWQYSTDEYGNPVYKVNPQ